MALSLLCICALLFACAVPFAKEPLGQLWPFIPAYEAALVVTDLITFVLLLGQFRLTRSRALLVLACGYLFTASITTLHALTYPGVFSPAGLLGAGRHTTAWIYMFWHGGFPLYVLAYALLRGSRREALPHGRSPLLASLAGSGLALLAAGLAVAWTTLGQDSLPALMTDQHSYLSSLTLVVSTVWLICLVTLGTLIWQRRPLTVLDLWLVVVMAVWLLDVGLSALFNAARFDLGFYAGRIFGLMGASFVLGRLLLESNVLYTKLAHAHDRMRRRSAELNALTEQLQAANAQLAAGNRQLEEQSRFKSDFLANMAHELRTPLNAVIGFSEMLKASMAGPLSDRQRTFATHIFQSGHHLLALINDILDLSKIEAGKVDIELEAVPLQALLTETLAMVDERARARQVRLLLAKPGPLGMLQADRRRLKQLLLNLLANAIKFSPDGGQVSVQVQWADADRASSALPGFREGLRMQPPAQTEAAPARPARYVEISVTDSGIGISAADLHKLFKPFTQIANSVTRQAEGTGLGLVMVHRLVELHNGMIAVTSEAGRGSCFTVWLPLRDETAHAAQQAWAPGSNRSSDTVHRLALVVEDNADAAALMRVQLEEQGFEVRWVHSAEEALTLAAECTPDLITLDIMLPGMDGWQFLAHMRTLPAWASVPVVVVSVVADHGRGYSLGAALVLQKPIARDALARGLERMGLAADAERKATVLVVDDDPIAVERLAGQLRQRGCVVLRALGGQEGIELAQRFRPDLIALDLAMPEVSGFDVAEALKNHPATRHIPIVAVTAGDLSLADRQQLNGRIQGLVTHADFAHGEFVGEVQRALARPAL